MRNFHIFIISLPLKVTLFSKSPYLTAHVKINYETGCIRSFLKNQRDVSKTIATDKMELFALLVASSYLAKHSLVHTEAPVLFLLLCKTILLK